VKVYRAGEAVKVTVPFSDGNGARLVPVSLSYRVVDDVGTVVKGSAAVTQFDVGQGGIDIIVAAADNDLGDEVAGFRRVELTITTASFEYVRQEDYLLEAAQLFLVGTNSFMTYETALVVARSLAPIPGWDVASVEARRFALFRAFDQLNSFSYTFEYPDAECSETQGSIEDLEEGEFLALKVSQILAFRKAQLLQADYLLGGNAIEQNIADGLQSSTVGEVSQFYRPRATLVLPVCKAALSYIGKYVRWGIRIGRA
jgi:hypothetical protein